jgi:hypothetical protein
VLVNTELETWPVLVPLVIVLNIVITERRVVGLRVVMGVVLSGSDVGSLLEPAVVSAGLSPCVLGELLMAVGPVAVS